MGNKSGRVLDWPPKCPVLARSFAGTLVVLSLSILFSTQNATLHAQPGITSFENQDVGNDPALCSAYIPLDVLQGNEDGSIIPAQAVRSDGKTVDEAFPIGATVITWYGLDASGGVLTQIITVYDNERPTIVCPNSISKPCDPCQTSTTLDTGVPSAYDNCGIQGVTGVRTDGKDLTDTYPVGETSIVWTAWDIYGNGSSCIQEIAITTGPCCTHTADYWKSHPEVESWPPAGNYLTLGKFRYDMPQLLDILSQPIGNNGLVSLAQQLIATKLNVANGADPTEISGFVAQADKLIGNKVVPPIGKGKLQPKQTDDLTGQFEAYNSGYIGPGHCNDD